MPRYISLFMCSLFHLLVSSKKTPLPHIAKQTSPPHIIMILADDLGWNEVGWHNRQVATPNLDKLGGAGVFLEGAYVHAKCSPSRAALLTGIYPFKMGRQRGAIPRFQPDGLDVNTELIPQMLARAGYKSSMVGKWHLGFCKEDYLPQNRGFDSFFGQWNYVTNYYTRRTELYGPDDVEGRLGYDLHRDGNITREGEGMFSPDLLSQKAVEVIHGHNSSRPLFLYLAYQTPHAPIQTPPQKYRNIYTKGPRQDRYAAISAMDAGIGKVVAALEDAGIYNNAVIVFSTDNGGPMENESNKPLRGVKATVWEGGVRGVALVHSPLIRKPGRRIHSLSYITDWYNTFSYLAGLGTQPNKDSFNQWPLISKDKPSPRKDVILNLDVDNYKGIWQAAIRMKNWKLIWGQPDLLQYVHQSELACQVRLYDLKEDPGEARDLSEEVNEFKRVPRRIKARIAEMKDRLMEQLKQMKKPVKNVAESTRGWPASHNGLFATGWC